MILRPRAVLSLVSVAIVLAAGCDRKKDPGLGPTVEVAAVVSPAAPSPSPSAAASPSPVASRPDEPAPSPSPDCIHGTSHGVSSVSLVLYFLECGGQRIPGTAETKSIPLGCRIHFNATPRDGMGRPTCSKDWPVWQVGPEHLVVGRSTDTFTPAYTPLAEGRMSARCIVDGVRSGWLVYDVVAR